MKSSNLFINLFCILSIGILGACEKTEIQKTSLQEGSKIDVRSEDCTYCPDDDCCCFVMLNGASSAYLAFCGTTNPDISTNECEVDLVDCPDISGFYWIEELNSSTNSNEFFCVAKGSSFMIGAGQQGGTSISFTCQYGQLNAQWINQTLSAGQKFYYTLGNDCIMSECHSE